AELPDQKKEEVLALIEDVNQASDLVDLLTYDEDSAGGLMAKELVKVQEDWTIGFAITEMRKQAEEIDEVYNIYVVDEQNRLKGTLSLKK
ncbi:MAG: CBS domain-containing protein, partial [Luteibaculum sp.]